MNSSLESRHFYLAGDVVQRLDGRSGEVVESYALWAVIRWDDGEEREMDQLDPDVVVLHRASGD